jgi:hypothetical protein
MRSQVCVIGAKEALVNNTFNCNDILENGPDCAGEAEFFFGTREQVRPQRKMY